MHPDRKIGIAMGILLVGVVAALFFRNEPLDNDGVLTVRRERELNERLRERDVAVYLETGSGEDDGATDAHLRLDELLSRTNSTVPSTPVPVRRDSADQRDSKQMATTSDHAPLRFEPPHNLLQSTADAETSGGTVQGGTQDHRQSLSEAVGAVKPELTDSQTDQPVEFLEYTVQFGDTLSGISERFLGSQSRYREIFDANKDRMSSPDRLQVGKAIRIPRVVR